MAEPTEPEAVELWTIVMPDGRAVQPVDGNEHDDEGMLVYRSRAAAQAAVAHHYAAYDGLETHALRIGVVPANQLPKD